MMSFSQRKGLIPVKTVIQVDGMDDDLRFSLWNVLNDQIWSRKTFMEIHAPPHGWNDKCQIGEFYRLFRSKFQKLTADEAPYQHDLMYDYIRLFYHRAEYHEVYDFLEFVLRIFSKMHPELAGELNEVLARELAGYRIISGVVADVTDEQEVAALEEALQDSRFEGVQSHLQRALEFLSDKTNPSYRNSIMESIHAVESLCRVITGKDKATLGEALTELESSGKIHNALKSSFSSLYGWTSDEGGIRHAMLEEPDLSANDAKFLLLSCTSFINYLKTKMD